jgi:parvulin-like peptidyl-prolyl isomerase
MHTSLHRFVIVGLGFLALVVAFAPPAQALPAPSKTAADQALVEREADLAALDAVLEQGEVMGILADHGFTREEVNERLAQLSPEELGSLAAQVDQLQAAGQPTYIWVLIAILAVVAIVAIAG